MLRTRICILHCVCLYMVWAKKRSLTADGDFLPHVRLAKDLMDPRRYDSRIRPVMNFTQRTRIVVSMSLYQILAINEKMQNIDLNVWVIQKWRDEFLGWSPLKYGLINNTILPYQRIWLPDTYIYNSVVMNREETERYINAVVTTNYWKKERGAQIMFMYPALYRTSCRIHIRFFPYDLQNCTLIISSWTSDKSSIDYVPEFDTVNLENFIPNEEWVVVSFHMRRKEEKFVCCPEPWVLLEASLVVRRKPLYYIVNLVVPTSVITLVAVTGFFTPASTSNERREKLSLGIDSLLAMSILLTMIAEQMPTISDYVPLFGIFYLAIIIIIFAGTLFSAFILNVHLQKTRNKPIPPLVSFIFFHKVAPFLSLRPPTTLLELWMETGVRIKGLKDADPKLPMRFSTNKRSLGLPAPRKEKEFTFLNGQNGNNEEKRNHLLGSPELFKRSQIETEWEPSKQGPSLNTPKTAQKARNNWKRLAARANAKRKEEQNKISDIPFADGASLAPSTGFEPMNVGPYSARHKVSTASRPQSMLPALQLLYMQQGGGPASGSAADAFLLDAKLRRRYAHEWEFLASVLDRVLLIVFSGLVLLVTAAMIAVGEAIHFSYSLVEDFPQNVTEFNQDF